MISGLLKKYNNMSNGLKASVWFMICSVLQKAVSFITIPIFTRILTADEYGSFSIFTSWESIVTVFATLNLSYQVFNNGMVKYKNDKDGYASSMIGLTLLSSIIFFVIFIIFNNTWTKYTGMNIVYICLMFLDMFFTAILGIWTVRQRYDFKYKLLVVITIFSTIANPTLGIILVLNFQDKVLARVISMIIIDILIGIFALIFLMKKGHKFSDIKYWKYALKLDLPLIPHYLSMVVLNSSDRIMIGNICGNSYSAYYSVAYNAAMVMQILLTSINSSFNPWIYHKLESKEYFDIRNVSRYLIILVAVVSIFPMLFGPELILILGSHKYMIASYVMSIISSSVFLIFIYSLYINIELFNEKSSYVTIGSILATVSNIILNIIFINKFGFLAAGYTTLVSYSLLALFHYTFAKKIVSNDVLNQIFDNKFILFISIIVVIISIIIQCLYKFVIIRYMIILLVLIIVFFNRKKVMYILSNIKTK